MSDIMDALVSIEGRSKSVEDDLVDALSNLNLSDKQVDILSDELDKLSVGTKRNDQITKSKLRKAKGIIKRLRSQRGTVDQWSIDNVDELFRQANEAKGNYMVVDKDEMDALEREVLEAMGAFDDDGDISMSGGSKKKKQKIKKSLKKKTIMKIKKRFTALKKKRQGQTPQLTNFQKLKMAKSKRTIQLYGDKRKKIYH